MDIERLTKSQIILLTLLVSFVTSIATGIVTVSLMDQAPPVVAQTVNRIIERTIETVSATSTTPKGQTAASVITQEKTVVVKESDLLAQAIEKVSPSIVRLYTGDMGNPVFLGFALVLDAQGSLIADAGAIGDTTDIVADVAGTRVRVSVGERDPKTGLARLTSEAETIDGKKPQWKPATIAADPPRLGQTVVAFSGKTVLRITDGIVTAMPPASESAPNLIETDISGESVFPGSPLVNSDGNVVGVTTSLSRASSPSAFVAVSVLMKPAAQ